MKKTILILTILPVAARLLLFLAVFGLAGGSSFAATFSVPDDLTVSGTGGTVPAPDAGLKGFSIFGSTDVLTHISTAPGNVVINGALEVSSDVYAAGLSTFTGSAFFGSTVTVGYIRGLSAPLDGDAAATKGYVDAIVDDCALGSATVADILAGKTADIDCDGIAETGTLGPSAPSVGGAWLLVPGDALLGTLDFYVQKYEAKDVSSVPTSQPSDTPWMSVTQWAAKTACEALGPGYHLLTMPEALTISRNIENNAWNWTGGSVGSGGLWRGHTDSTPNNSLAADVTGDPDDDPYVGTGNTTPSIERRVHQLSSGQYLWDWSGNVWEWVDMTCTAGTGAGYWYYTAAWIEWSNANLSDYEKPRAGPSGAYTSTQNAGRYYGCSATGNAVFRGGNWTGSTNAGVFAIFANYAPSISGTGFGFRCGK